MRISKSVSQCYWRQYDVNVRLMNEVDRVIEDTMNKKWHYFGRVKGEVSYALKIEKEQNLDPYNLEDFFACTIVVENYDMIQKAEKFITEFCEIKKRKPKRDNFTSKRPDSFPFDNLRLLVRFKHDKRMPENYESNMLSGITFEIQIKTFLQHAWDIASHDLIYKGKEISWPKRRVAYQLKAMLEHAEISIYEIEKIKTSSMINKHHKKIDRMNEIKDLLIKKWDEAQLPDDLTRLSGNVNMLLKKSRISVTFLEKILDAEFDVGRGAETLELSPYFTILQAIINQNPDAANNFFSSVGSGKKMAMPSEMDVGDLVPSNVITWMK